MERLGIPTASIITHVFLNTAKAMTRMMGVPDFEFVVAQHPISNLTDEECKEESGQHRFRGRTDTTGRQLWYPGLRR